MKTTIQTLSDKSFYDGFPNADNGIKDFLFVTTRRVDLNDVKDISQWFYS